MTPFNCSGKKARDVGLTCRCHPSNIMPGSIFCDSMGRGMTQGLFCLFDFCFFVAFLRGGNRCQPRRDGFSLITITPVGMGKTSAITD